jgi:hypothetical protein
MRRERTHRLPRLPADRGEVLHFGAGPNTELRPGVVVYRRPVRWARRTQATRPARNVFYRES